ncbi:H-2 class I histocompatibility antigen, Q9 alpha chain-like isoform X2 [Amblyraja radiata]|uniref:H-2 class I histocompatibility antigen, Q9 alpha chain-like isoform X2 n=1 Tax=Amblyraja radiata TaxID=386614 RepID=UPI0014038827|nr:H-2 class I histocompatibility antigen, Q9 alpha chain-like isoform X2 [Amblyraja radiata]
MLCPLMLQLMLMLMLLMLLPALLAGAQAAGSHSLRYFFTGVTPGSGIPEFTAVGYVDDEQIDYYDSVSQRAEPRQRWMAESRGADYWERETQRARRWETRSKFNIQTLERRTNQSGGIHTVQMMYGCELRSDGSSAGFCQYGWDGEDFISFDKEHMVWVTPVPWGLLTKHEWDRNTGYNLQNKAYLEETCIEWLQKYVQAGQSHLTPVQPEVSIFLSGDGSRVWCFTTGFYPRSIEVNLVRDGLVLDESRSHGTLPNHDGTFQQGRWVHVEPGDTAPLSCRVEHPGLSEPLEVFLVRKSGINVMTIVLVFAVLVLAVAALVGGVLYWKKKQASERGEN